MSKGETSWGAYVPDLPGCVAVGETEKEVKQLIQKAIEFHLEDLTETGAPIPQPMSKGDYVEVSAAGKHCRSFTSTANDLDRTITDGGQLTHSYSVESNNEVKMSRQDIIQLIENAGFEAVERDTVCNRTAAV